jgi:hypothetical protein
MKYDQTSILYLDQQAEDAWQHYKILVATADLSGELREPTIEISRALHLMLRSAVAGLVIGAFLMFLMVKM